MAAGWNWLGAALCVALLAGAARPDQHRPPLSASAEAAPQPGRGRGRAGAGAAPPPRRARSVLADGWSDLIASYVLGAGGAGAWIPRPLSIDLPIGAARSSVPLLVLPVPVPVAAPGPAPPRAPAKCVLHAATGDGRYSEPEHDRQSENHAQSDFDGGDERYAADRSRFTASNGGGASERPAHRGTRPRGRPRPATGADSREPERDRETSPYLTTGQPDTTTDDRRKPTGWNRERITEGDIPTERNKVVSSSSRGDSDRNADYDRAHVSGDRKRLWAIERRPLGEPKLKKTESVPTTEWAPTYESAPTPKRVPTTERAPTGTRRTRAAPSFEPVDDTELLVKQFREQVRPDPSFPPIALAAAPGGEPSGEPTGQPSGARPCRRKRSVARARAGAAPERAGDSFGRTGDSFGRTGDSFGRTGDSFGRTGDSFGRTGAAPPPPPLPTFDRSVMLRARLTVPRAGYTEPYTLWWDAASGAARVDFHGGAASSYRLVSFDGLVRSVLVREDRSGAAPVRRCAVSEPRRASLAERALPALPDLAGFSFDVVCSQASTGTGRSGAAPVRRCAVSEPRRASLAERALPALPDLAGFSFDGYIKAKVGLAERWVRTVEGEAGGVGGVGGEALTFHHELVVKRVDNFTTAPLRYSMSVDSSVLGPYSDGYVHRFTEVRYTHHEPAMFQLDIEETCEAVERAASMWRVEPLREFVALRRDARYERDHERYQKTYERRYANDVEEAVRKSLLIQSVRLVDSGNRQGSNFELGANFLADRLVTERAALLGGRGEGRDGGAAGAERFPHEARELEAAQARLPRRFDWRERGGVTHVRNQWTTCASCWAFAVAGAVEGALFARTGRLVPLSEQALVDCAHPYGGRGCKGTWPSSAYNYIQDRGLPALDDYTPYKAKVQQCAAARAPLVTRISGHVNVTANNVVALKTAISRHGPTVVIIDGQADSFALYKKGHYSDARCRKNTADHAVLAVGWSAHDGETYFTLKNSWSEAWGEAGYVRLRGAGNTCGVLSRASFPRLAAADVRRVPPNAAAAAQPAPAPAR